jgi:hypothetical protein
MTHPHRRTEILDPRRRPEHSKLRQDRPDLPFVVSRRADARALRCRDALAGPLRERGPHARAPHGFEGKSEKNENLSGFQTRPFLRAMRAKKRNGEVLPSGKVSPS